MKLARLKAELVAVGDLALGAVGPAINPALMAGTGETATAFATMMASDLAVKVAYGRENGLAMAAQVQGQPLVRVRETMDYLANRHPAANTLHRTGPGLTAPCRSRLYPAC